MPHPLDFKRMRRSEVPGQARALNFSCFKNQPFLSSNRACLWLADSLTNALENHHIHLWAFCFMPTHVHLLVLPLGSEPDISRFLESLKKSVTNKALSYIRAHNPSGVVAMRDEQPSGKVHHRFWQRGGGYDRNLNSPESVWKMIRYIHANPLTDMLVEREHHWHWSSAAHYAQQSISPITLNLTHLPDMPD